MICFSAIMNLAPGGGWLTNWLSNKQGVWLENQIPSPDSGQTRRSKSDVSDGICHAFKKVSIRVVGRACVKPMQVRAYITPSMHTTA